MLDEAITRAKGQGVDSAIITAAAKFRGECLALMQTADDVYQFRDQARDHLLALHVALGDIDAEAVAAVVHDPERGVYRAVVGATHGSPIVIAEARDAGAAAEVMAAAAQGFDDYETQVHEVALRRAFQALEQG